MNEAQLNSQIRMHSGAFRTALETAGSELEAPGLRSFPRGSCGDVSELLGEYFRDSGLGDWLYRSGVRSDPWFSHAWLERRGVVVDITADQFPEISERVIVTVRSDWHRLFRSMAGDGRLAGLAYYVGHDHQDKIERDYARLCLLANEALNGI